MAMCASSAPPVDSAGAHTQSRWNHDSRAVVVMRITPDTESVKILANVHSSLQRDNPLVAVWYGKA